MYSPLALFALFAFLKRREKFEYSFYKLRRIDTDDFVHICPLFYTKYVSETACVKTGKQKNGNRRFLSIYANNPYGIFTKTYRSK